MKKEVLITACDVCGQKVEFALARHVFKRGDIDLCQDCVLEVLGCIDAGELVKTVNMLADLHEAKRKKGKKDE